MRISWAMLQGTLVSWGLLIGILGEKEFLGQIRLLNVAS